MRQRLRRSLHANLVARARAEGTSLNTLVTMLLAEGPGRRESQG
jgi:predicted HicB family RNase H-like nuclease